jgi:hypothetical protein
LENLQRIIEVFTHKKLLESSQKCVLDSGSEIQDTKKNLIRIPDPKFKKAPDPGHQIPDLEPQHWQTLPINYEKSVKTV